MTSVELKARLEQAEAKVEKCKATIERHKKQAEKKLQIVKENGWDPTNRYALYVEGAEQQSKEYHDSYWAVCEYESKLEDIKGAERKLADAEQVVNNWKAKLDKQVAVELAIANEIPEAFKQARAELVEEWVASDIRAREIMLKREKELSHKEFRKIYKYSQEEDLRKTDEEFRKIEEREADYWLLNLYNRVKEITGEVTDCRYLRWGGKCLDGYVVGKNGKARVETIGAGGWNIQRYHLRVLVHEM